jgi:hypothetical protein
MLGAMGAGASTVRAEEPIRIRSAPPVIVSAWDDLLEGVQTPEDWAKHRELLRQRFLDLIRDQKKPPRHRRPAWHLSAGDRRGRALPRPCSLGAGIGSQSVAEIAISIVAQLIACRNLDVNLASSNAPKL